MFYKQLLSLLLILPPLLFGSCDKDDNNIITNEDRLPPITMEGKQTFACLLNGEVWKHTPYPFSPNLTADYSPHWKILNISASRKHDGILESFIFITAEFENPGIYEFRCVEYFDHKYHDVLSPVDTEFLIENEPHFIEITHLDLDQSIVSGLFQSIVSGLFQFSLLDTLTGDTLRFTEGRFDFDWAN